MKLQRICVHRFRDGCVGRQFCIFDTTTGRLRQQRIGPNELRRDLGFYTDEFVLWQQAIEEYFISEWERQIVEQGERVAWECIRDVPDPDLQRDAAKLLLMVAAKKQNVAWQ